MIVKGLPFFAAGKVVKGFGRGSKDLGIPTANFPESVVNGLPESVGTGVYYGFASVDGGPVHKMVMSIGTNPFYKNEKKSMETHILHKFDSDFYGSILRICMVGFIRHMENYKSLEALIEAINQDIDAAKELCDRPENARFAEHSFFRSPVDVSSGEEEGAGGSQAADSDSETSVDH